MNPDESGILERVLVRRYGEPELKLDRGMRTKVWRGNTELASELYYWTDWSRPPASDFRMHQPIYGNCCGGILVNGSLKVAMPSAEKRFGVYNIRELLARMEVQRAMALDPELSFFMDAANVWFFGHKQGRLFVYDHPFDELYERGPIESALEEIIVEWEEAKSP